MVLVFDIDIDSGKSRREKTGLSVSEEPVGPQQHHHSYFHSIIELLEHLWMY